MIARFLRSYSRRRWAYATGELVAISTCALCAFSLLKGQRYQLVVGDTGISPFTAACVGALALAVFIITVVVREQDDRA